MHSIWEKSLLEVEINTDLGYAFVEIYESKIIFLDMKYTECSI